MFRISHCQRTRIVGVTYDFVSKTVIHDFHTPAIAGTMTIDLKGHGQMFFPSLMIGVNMSKQNFMIHIFGDNGDKGAFSL